MCSYSDRVCDWASRWLVTHSPFWACVRCEPSKHKPVQVPAHSSRSPPLPHSLDSPWPLERCLSCQYTARTYAYRKFVCRISVSRRVRRVSRRRSSTPSPARVSLVLLFLLFPVLNHRSSDWYDIKAPSIFEVKNVGKTLVNRSQGLSTYPSPMEHFFIQPPPRERERFVEGSYRRGFPGRPQQG